MDLASVQGKADKAVDNSAQLAKLRKEAAKLAPLIAQLEAKFGNADYLAKTPAAAQGKDREKFEKYKKEHAEYEATILKLT